ncbi:MAG: 3-deoxy-7-phosphoheptulonate synthase [bacterium]|nr:3-deoxy-7-phosphoheptulonate synthase [bacterium]
MLVVMSKNAAADDIRKVISLIESEGLTPHDIPGAIRTAIGVTGNTGAIDTEKFAVLPGVVQVIRVTSPFKLVSRETKPENTIVKVRDAVFGGKELTIIAGPCSVESREQIEDVVFKLKDAGAKMIRGGVYKPRTSPYSFQGLGRKGLEILAEAREKTGLPFVTEVLDIDKLPEIAEFADMLQIGARNMQNFPLLRAVGKTGKPVLLKRGISATLDEFFMAAEYILAEGNYDVVLCERGIRTFARHTRFTLDISVIPTIRKLSHLPVIADPSHSGGERDKVLPLSLGAIGAGADGLIVEVHPEPDKALSDGQQSLYPKQFEQLMDKIRTIAPVLEREM